MDFTHSPRHGVKAHRKFLSIKKTVNLSIVLPAPL
nr:MAG TPA: hypothetical protein [Caudoviricetes sp.]